MKSLFLICFIAVSISVKPQERDRKINFPDVNGFKTLKTDFHIHTVFSDGYVWPTIRVDEAVRDGLDAIALTEHIEYQPWKEDIPHPDRNRSFELTKEYAKKHDLLLIHGTEITRGLPPGHANALFVKDVNELIVKDAMESYRLARKQGAFIFWNHPNWIRQQKDGLPKLTKMHQQLIKEDLLHGIEVVNDLTFSEGALQIANDNGLTVMGTSDIHGLVDYQYEIAKGGHRPICLVLAKERSQEAIKEALFAGRTVTWFNEILAGKKEPLKMLMDASLNFKNLGYITDTEVIEIEINNLSDAKFFLQNTSLFDFHKNTGIIEVLPHSQKTLQLLMARNNIGNARLTFTVLNAVQGHKDYYKLEVPLD